MIYAAVLLIVLAAIVVTFLATAAFVGSRLPPAHHVSRSARYAESIAKVWDAVADPASARTFGVARIEQAIPVPGRVLVRRIVGARDFGGTWTYELEPEGSGTRLTITEEAELYNPIFRFLARFVLGQTRALDAYLEWLRRQL